MNDCLDRADADKAKAIVLEGRAGTFSAGFDLKEFQKGPEATLSLVRSGFEMLLRLFEFPRPVAGSRCFCGCLNFLDRLSLPVRAMVLAWGLAAMPTVFGKNKIAARATPTQQMRDFLASFDI
jgi:hypothetical protein